MTVPPPRRGLRPPGNLGARSGSPAQTGACQLFLLHVETCSHVTEVGEAVTTGFARRTSSSANYLLRADSNEDFRRKLDRIDISVPRRGCGRTKDHTELFSMVKLLGSQYVARFFLTYPVAVRWQEKPDFVLEMSGRDIGIEQTEAVYENQAEKDTLRNSESRFQVTYRFAEIHSPEDLKKTRAELIEELQIDPHNKHAEGWSGYELEISWAIKVRDIINKKLKKRKDYALCSTHWLLIHDNLEPPCLRSDTALSYLKAELANHGEHDDQDGFDHIWILTGRNVCHLSKGKEFAVCRAE